MGAIFEMARILQTMRIKYAEEKHLSFNPGLILGGTKINYNDANSLGDAFGKQNVVAKMAMAKGDFRFLTTEQKKSFEKSITALVKQSLPGTKSTVEFENGIPAMQPTKNNLVLLEQYSKASNDLGLGVIKPLDPGLRGAGDISHVAAIVPANLAGLGPMGWGAHSIIESIELNSLPIQTKRAAILIYRLSR
jgi:glutamate carboxypeptidase